MGTEDVPTFKEMEIAVKVLKWLDKYRQIGHSIPSSATSARWDIIAQMDKHYVKPIGDTNGNDTDRSG